MDYINWNKEPCPKIKCTVNLYCTLAWQLYIICNADELKILMGIEDYNVRSTLCAPSQATDMHIKFFPACQGNLKIQKSPERVSWNQRTLVPGFLGQHLLQPLSHSNVCCIMTEKGSKNPPKQALLQGKETFFAFLSWSEYALCYQRGLKPPKRALAPVPNCNNAPAHIAITFSSAAWVWLSHPRTAEGYCNLTRKHFTQILWLDLVCSNQA